MNILFFIVIYDVYDFLYFFFFSSRRRHTRLQGDWSSDVCSSDLSTERTGARIGEAGREPAYGGARAHALGAARARAHGARDQARGEVGDRRRESRDRKSVV